MFYFLFLKKKKKKLHFSYDEIKEIPFHRGKIYLDVREND